MKREVKSDTKLRVVRSKRRIRTEAGDDRYNNPEFFCITTLGNLFDILRLKHPDAIRRVRSELEGGSPLSLLYHEDFCIAVGIEELTS